MKTANKPTLLTKKTAVVVLAAGKGTRIQADRARNKVAYMLAEKPMIAHTVSHLQTAGFKHVIVVVGFAAESVRQVLGTSVVYALQSKRLGTGHALAVGLKKVPPYISQIISVYGDDSAFYPINLYHQLLTDHLKHNADLSLITIKQPDPTGLGRIIRDSQGKITAIIEDKNATPKQKQIKEINTGLFCFRRSFLEWGLPRIKKNPVSLEYYLVDLVALAVQSGYRVNPVLWRDASVWQGVNTPAELKLAAQRMKTQDK